MYHRRPKILPFLPRHLHHVIQPRINHSPTLEIAHHRVENITIRENAVQKYSASELETSYHNPFLELDHDLYPNLQSVSIYGPTSIHIGSIASMLRVLDITRVILTDNMTDAICDYLQHTKTLEILGLTDISWNVTNKQRVKTAVGNYVMNHGLTSLSFDCEMTAEDVVILQALHSAADITILTLNFDVAEAAVISESVQDTFVGLVANASLRKIDFKFEDASNKLVCERFCETLSRANDLRMISLHIEIDSNYALWPRLTQAFRQHVGLECLELKLYLMTDQTRCFNTIWRGFVDIVRDCRVSMLKVEFYCGKNYDWHAVTECQTVSNPAIQCLDIILAPCMQLKEHLMCLFSGLVSLRQLHVTLYFYRMHDASNVAIISSMNNYLLIACMMHRNLVNISFRVSMLQADDSSLHKDGFGCDADIAAKIWLQLLENRKIFWRKYASLKLQSAFVAANHHDVIPLSNTIPRDLYQIIHDMQHLTFSQVFENFMEITF